MPQIVRSDTHTGITAEHERKLRRHAVPVAGFDPNEDPVIIGDGAADVSGTPDNPSGGRPYNVVIGTSANTTGAGADRGIAIGAFASATGTWPTAVGASATASTDRTTAIGRSALASANASTAIGYGAEASGSDSTAVGESSAATAQASLAVGLFAAAVSRGSLAVGSPWVSGSGIPSGAAKVGASCDNSIAIGADAYVQANADNSIAIGSSVRTGDGSTSMSATIAIGYGAAAYDVEALAIGSGADASQAQSTAIGAGARAHGTTSTAIGAGASVTSSNQIMLGTTSETVVMPGNFDGSYLPTTNPGVGSGLVWNNAGTLKVA